MNQFQSVEEIVSALMRRAVMILAIAFLGCVVSVYYALSQPKSYQATAVVQIEDAQVPDQLAGASLTDDDAARRVRLIEQRLMARDNLVRLMDQYDLFSEDPTMTVNQRVNGMRSAARIQEIRTPVPGYGAGGVAPSGLMITVELNDPDKAALVANELMAMVIEQSRDRSVSRARDTVDFFAEEETRVSTEIEALDARIAGFKRDNAEQLPAGMGDLRTQLSSLRETELNLDQQILTIETTSERQREEVKQRQIALLQEQKALIAARVSQLETLIQGAPEVERALNGLEREMTRLQELYEVTTRRKAEAELGRALEDRQATDRFEVLETALPPQYAVSGSRKKIAVVGAVVSLLAGLGLAFAVELMNPVIRNPAQMERALGVQPVVSIPRVSTRRDRRIGGLRVIGKVVAVVALIAAGLRLIWDRVPVLAELAGRFLPRLIRN
jgi:tyrosine-protein kinase Etk/Wzc